MQNKGVHNMTGLSFLLSHENALFITGNTERLSQRNADGHYKSGGEFMRKTKKLLCFALAMGMVVASMSACGKAKSDKFYIGGSGPITGDAAVYGKNVENGAKLAVKEINAAGGINGKQIEFMFADDEADGEKAVNAYNSLRDKGMKMFMGTVTSGACASVMEKTNADKMFELTPSGSSKDLTKYGNLFQVCFSDPNQGIASAKYIGEKKLATKVAIIYDSSDIYSSGIEAKFEEEAKNQGLNVVAKEAFTADSKSDFSVQIQKAKDSGAELVFLPIYYKEATLILKQASDISYKPIFFGCDGLDGILTVENFDKSLAEGLMLLTPFSPDSEDAATQKFVTAFKAEYKDAPNQFAADAYDAMYIIKAAAEQEKVKPDMSISAINEAMKKAMTEITFDGLTGTGMNWANTGEVNKTPRVFKIENSKYVLAE
jgi:branched-chain amino acid transport system substrate-binding protein